MTVWVTLGGHLVALSTFADGLLCLNNHDTEPSLSGI